MRSSPDQDFITEAAPLEKRLMTLLADNALEEMWGAFYLSNIFLFPLYARFEAEHQITRPEFVTLYCLHHLGPLIAQEVSELTGLPKNSVSRGVKRLLSKSLIEMTRDKDDRRRNNLKMSDAGQELFNILLVSAKDRRATLIEPLSSAERAMLHEIVLRLSKGARERLQRDGMC